jgi:hypothetical protein
MAFYRGPRIVTNNLVLALDAANLKSYAYGSTLWNDLSGNNNSGSLINAPALNNDGAGSLVFNGIDQNATLPSLNLQQNFTLDGWFKPNVLNGFALFGQGSQFPNGGLHIWYTSNATIRFGMYANDTDFTVSTPTGSWYNIVFTYNNSNPYAKQMYINGVAVSGTPQQAQSAYAGNGAFRLGATYSSGGNYGNGSYAGMKIYNRILSALEVQQNYNAISSRFQYSLANISTYLTLTQAAGLSIYDNTIENTTYLAQYSSYASASAFALVNEPII